MFIIPLILIVLLVIFSVIRSRKQAIFIYRLEWEDGKSLFSGDRGKDLLWSSWGDHNGIHEDDNWLDWVGYAYQSSQLSESFFMNSCHPFHLPNARQMAFGWVGVDALNRNFPGWEKVNGLVLKKIKLGNEISLSKDYFVGSDLQILFNREMYK